MSFTTLGYSFTGFIAIFFLYLVFILFRNAPIERETSKIVAIVGSILWVIMMPFSAIAGLVGLMGSSAPGTKMWVVLLTMFSLLLVFLLSLYSITNIWQHYKSDRYKQVILAAMAPYAGIFLFIIAISIQFFFSQSKIGETPTTQNSPQLTISTENPVELFQKKFTTGDYRVVITGTKGSPEPFYFEHGQLVRVGDPNDGLKKIDSIIKNGRLFVVDTDKKTFKSFDVQTEPGKTIVESLKLLSFLDPFLETVKKDNFTWSNLDENEVQISNRHERVEGSGYLANQMLKIDYGKGMIESIAIKLFLDPTSNLITTILSSREVTTASSIWGVTRFQFEPISNIEEIKKFPMDYKQGN